MRSEKCTHCGLVNPAGSDACRRCGLGLVKPGSHSSSRRSPKDAAKRFSLRPWLIILMIAAAGYYLYQGAEKSYENVATTDDKRVATERKDAPPGLTRTEYDNRRAGQYGTAVSNSQSLATSQQHTNEINKLMK